MAAENPPKKDGTLMLKAQDGNDLLSSPANASSTRLNSTNPPPRENVDTTSLIVYPGKNSPSSSTDSNANGFDPNNPPAHPQHISSPINGVPVNDEITPAATTVTSSVEPNGETSPAPPPPFKTCLVDPPFAPTQKKAFFTKRGLARLQPRKRPYPLIRPQLGKIYDGGEYDGSIFDLGDGEGASRWIKHGWSSGCSERLKKRCRGVERYQWRCWFHRGSSRPDQHRDLSSKVELPTLSGR